MVSKTKSPQRPYSDADLKDVSDNPEWTMDDFARARPASDVLPAELFEKLKRRQGERGLQKKPTKQLVSLRLDRVVIELFKETGPGWQSRMNDFLRKALG